MARSIGRTKDRDTRSQNAQRREAPVLSALFVIFVAATMLSASARAATPSAVEPSPAANSAELSEIIVTAQRRAESIQTVPVAITAIDRQALLNQQVVTTADLQQVVPGLILTTNVTSPTDLQPAIRGTLEQNGGMIPTESPIGIYVDDVYISSLMVNNTALPDVDRVEVLRGPQGTLYGRNSLGGAIKYVTRTPGDTPWLDMTVGGGNYQSYLANASVGGPLTPGLAGSLAVQAMGHEGYFTNVATGRSIGRENDYAMRGKLRFMGVEGLDVVLSASFTKSTNDGTVEPPAQAPVTPTGQFRYSQLTFTAGGPFNVDIPVNKQAFGPLTKTPSGDSQQTILSVNASYQLAEIQLRSISAYVNTKDNFTDDLSGVGFFWLGSTVNLNQFTEELQAQGDPLNGRLHYIVGLYFLRQTGTQDFGWQIGIPLSTSNTSIATTSYAAYAQVDYDITDRFTATVGLRGLEDQKEFSFNLHGIVVPSDGPVSRNNNYTAETPHFGLKYKLDPGGDVDDAMLYATASRGFKPGGYNNGGIGNANDARVPYGPETNWSYDLGVKSDFYQHRLTLDATAFYEIISGLQIGAPVPLPGGVVSFTVQNAGRVQLEGFELEAAAKPIEGVRVFVSSSLLRGHYTDYEPGSVADQAAKAYGTAKLPLIPPYTLTVGGSYEHPIPFAGQEARVSLGADWYHSASYYSGAVNTEITDAYDQVNGYIALAPSPRWELRLSGRNLFDKTPIISGVPALGAFLPLAPRTYFLALRYKL